MSSDEILEGRSWGHWYPREEGRVALSQGESQGPAWPISIRTPQSCTQQAMGWPLTYIFILDFLFLSPVENPDDLTYRGAQAFSGLTRGQRALTISSPVKVITTSFCLAFPASVPSLRVGLAP